MRGPKIRGIAAVFFGTALMIATTANPVAAGDRTALRAATHGVQQQPHHGRRGYWRQKYYPRKRGLRRQLSYRQWGRRCQPVSKVSRDAYGRRTVVGGTLCFDGYGKSYIVRGSRYVIE